MSGIRNGFEDVETIYDVDKKDICVVISRAVFTGEHRFGIFKEFKDEEGTVRRTSFVKPHNLDALLRVAVTAAARCDVLAKEWAEKKRLEEERRGERQLAHQNRRQNPNDNHRRERMNPNRRRV